MLSVPREAKFRRRRPFEYLYPHINYVDHRVSKVVCIGDDHNVPLGFLSLTEAVMTVAIVMSVMAAPPFPARR